jgi:ATP-dependent RNA helicase DHX29
VRMFERQSDLQDITHIVLDEVHERNIESDFLLIVLRRLMKTRPQLKVILMSATVDAERFSSYLGGAPILDIPGRSFPVKVKYLEDAVELTNYHLDANRSHASFDDGDDFYHEVTPNNTRNDSQADSLQLSLQNYSKATKETVLKFDETRLDYSLIMELIFKIATEEKLKAYSSAILIFVPGLAEIRRLRDKIAADPAFDKGWTIHVLHSSITSDDQEKAFVVPPKGVRKIVISTNIAETGEQTPSA